MFDYFNPRPREEGDFDPGYIYTADASISIHALVKRATIFFCSISSSKLYFNPRPREEGDYGKVGRLFKRNNFNPRPREEGDFTNHDKNTTVSISIHALVKRAT